jgi:energy-coupling factor transporter ATP-binding protein EcfA2
MGRSALASDEESHAYSDKKLKIRNYLMDEHHWLLDRLEIRGGFLESIDLEFPPGLTCIIGPRGSGKSTLAEALRCGMAGVEGASKSRMDLFKANLARSALTIRTKPGQDSISYVIRREGRQPALITTNQEKTLSAVDLDRGTFLPIDGYSSSEIEQIADESLGARRRTLLDELYPQQFAELLDRLATARRALEANGDAVRSTRRLLTDLGEQIQALAHAQERLADLPTSEASGGQAAALQDATRQQQLSREEEKQVQALLVALSRLGDSIGGVAEGAKNLPRTVTPSPRSRNQKLVTELGQIVSALADSIAAGFEAIQVEIVRSQESVSTISGTLAQAHREQAAELALLREQDQVAGEAARERAEAEQAVQRLGELELSHVEQEARLERLLRERDELRGRYLRLQSEMSNLRDRAATQLAGEAGQDVRIVVRRNADILAYHQLLSEGLRGAGVKGHDLLIEQLAKLRPDELAQLIFQRNAEELDAVCGIGLDRSRRILEAFRQTIDPLVLEVLVLEDLIGIELNVGLPDQKPLYKDASGLSRGQKCTALLPLLLARRRTPLVVDQPEDNLDNHFIFRSVVNVIQRLKSQRQMIFITHNANIPVLAEADLVVVLGSDGSHGYIEKQGSLDDCKGEIIDLLEGGREAFEKRRLRYV